MFQQPDYTSLLSYEKTTIPVDQLIKLLEVSRCRWKERLECVDSDRNEKERATNRLKLFDALLRHKQEISNHLIPDLKSKGVRRIGWQEKTGQFGFIAPLGEKQLLRISLPELEDRYDTSSLPIVLQPLASWQTGPFKIDAFPEVATQGVTEGQVAACYHIAKAFGYYFWDSKKDNVGLLNDGLPVILDPGAVVPFTHVNDTIKLVKHKKRFIDRLRDIETNGGYFIKPCFLDYAQACSDNDTFEKLIKLQGNLQKVDSTNNLGRAITADITNLYKANSLWRGLQEQAITGDLQKAYDNIMVQLSNLTAKAEKQKNDEVSDDIVEEIKATARNFNTVYKDSMASLIKSLRESVDKQDQRKCETMLENISDALLKIPDGFTKQQQALMIAPEQALENAGLKDYADTLYSLCEEVANTLPESQEAQNALHSVKQGNYFEVIGNLVSVTLRYDSTDPQCNILASHPQLQEKTRNTLDEVTSDCDEVCVANVREDLLAICDKVEQRMDEFAATAALDILPAVEQHIAEKDYAFAAHLLEMYLYATPVAERIYDIEKSILLSQEDQEAIMLPESLKKEIDTFISACRDYYEQELLAPLREHSIKSQQEHLQSLGLKHGDIKYAIPDEVLRRRVALGLGVSMDDVDIDAAKQHSVLARTVTNAALDQESLGMLSNQAVALCSDEKPWQEIIDQAGREISR